MAEWQELLAHRPPAAPLRGRWAPSPTGALHIGNARTALAAWLSIRSRGGRLLWRLEDLDPQRSRPELARQAEEDLRWLGLDWDLAAASRGPASSTPQSTRHLYYETALEELARLGRLFPCRRSRRELQDLAAPPLPGREEQPYPPALRPALLPMDKLPGKGSNLRFRVDEGVVHWEDALRGPQEEDVSRAVGDFVLRRRDGVYAYQLAVVVDDILTGITEVLRGGDLLQSTARQILLYRALGAAPPRWIHVPLLLDPAGRKLGKRDGDLEVAALRNSGVTPAALCGWLGASLGLLDPVRPCRPEELLPLWSTASLRQEDQRLPADLPRRLLRL